MSIHRPYTDLGIDQLEKLEKLEKLVVDMPGANPINDALLCELHHRNTQRALRLRSRLEKMRGRAAPKAPPAPKAQPQPQQATKPSPDCAPVGRKRHPFGRLIRHARDQTQALPSPMVQPSGLADYAAALELPNRKPSLRCWTGG